MSPVLEEIKFGDIQMFLPKSVDAIDMARELLDMFEEMVAAGWVCKYCGCTETTPCNGGCCWIAPNVCSRCAEKEKPETLRNVSSLRSSSVKRVKEATLEYSDILPEDNRAGVSPSEPKSDTHDISNVVPGIETKPGFESPAASSFSFRECEPFKWFNLPTFRAGKTMYHIAGGIVHILRQGYESNQLFVSMNDLRYLYDHTDEISRLDLNSLKRTMLRGFLQDVDFATIGIKTLNTLNTSNTSTPAPGETKLPEEIPQNEVKCPRCGGLDFIRKEKKLRRKGTAWICYCNLCQKSFTTYQEPPRKWRGRPIVQKTPEREQKPEKIEQNPVKVEHTGGDDPDRAFKPMLHTDTRGNHGDDFEKIEGTLE